jgi:hypothetical protein
MPQVFMRKNYPDAPLAWTWKVYTILLIIKEKLSMNICIDIHTNIRFVQVHSYVEINLLKWLYVPRSLVRQGSRLRNNIDANFVGIFGRTLYFTFLEPNLFLSTWNARLKHRNLRTRSGMHLRTQGDHNGQMVSPSAEKTRITRFILSKKYF